LPLDRSGYEAPWKKGYCGGQIIAYFVETSKLYYWDVDDLK
jgi:hypothetical protein